MSASIHSVWKKWSQTKTKTFASVHLRPSFFFHICFSLILTKQRHAQVVTHQIFEQAFSSLKIKQNPKCFALLFLALHSLYTQTNYKLCSSYIRSLYSFFFIEFSLFDNCLWPYVFLFHSIFLFAATIFHPFRT